MAKHRVNTSLRALRRGGDHAYLDFGPQALTHAKIAVVICYFIWRSFLHFLGFGRDFIEDSAGGYELPELELTMPFRLSQQDFDAYDTAVSCRDSCLGNGLLPRSQTCLMLAAYSEPAMLLLLAHRQCPVRPLGSVNVRNRFEMLKPEHCTLEALQDFGRGQVRAKLIKKTKMVKRGVEFDVQVDVMFHVDNELTTVFRQVFTILQFMKHNRNITAQDHKMIIVDDEDTPEKQQFSMFMHKKSPHQWARICKDYNPIHLSFPVAWLFGFKGRLAHGNHVVAIILAKAFHARGGAVQKEHFLDFDKMQIDVNFIRPIVLPNRLQAKVIGRMDAKELGLTALVDGKECLNGMIRVS